MSYQKYRGLAAAGITLGAFLSAYSAKASVCPLPSQGQFVRGGTAPSPLNQNVVFDLSAPVYRTELKNETVYDLVPQCREREVYGGRSRLWDQFYNANRYEKADALADAILGVGYITAKKLVRDGYFDRKPRTWREFSDQIYKADRRYRSGFSREVLGTYAEENQRRLGYLGLACWNTKVPRIVQVPVRVFSHCESRKIKVEVENSFLGQGEYETIHAYFDGYEDSVQMKSNSNRYVTQRTETSREVRYTYNATRTRVRPLNRLTLDVSRNPSDHLQVVVTFAGWEDSAIAEGFARIEGTLTCGRSWSRVSTPFTQKLSDTGETTEFDLGNHSESCVNPNIKYVLRIVGSPYFMNTESTLISRDYDL